MTPNQLCQINLVDKKSFQNIENLLLLLFCGHLIGFILTQEDRCTTFVHWGKRGSLSLA